MVERLLSIEGLQKSFGGVTATDNVYLDVLEGETHTVIGPNGAGKTTLISQLSGALRPWPRNPRAPVPPTPRVSSPCPCALSCLLCPYVLYLLSLATSTFLAQDTTSDQAVSHPSSIRHF